jgi:hypothetical protein
MRYRDNSALVEMHSDLVSIDYNINADGLIWIVAGDFTKASSYQEGIKLDLYDDSITIIHLNYSEKARNAHRINCKNKDSKANIDLYTKIAVSVASLIRNDDNIGDSINAIAKGYGSGVLSQLMRYLKFNKVAFQTPMGVDKYVNSGTIIPDALYLGWGIYGSIANFHNRKIHLDNLQKVRKNVYLLTFKSRSVKIHNFNDKFMDYVIFDTVDFDDDSDDAKKSKALDSSTKHLYLSDDNSNEDEEEEEDKYINYSSDGEIMIRQKLVKQLPITEPAKQLPEKRVIKESEEENEEVEEENEEAEESDEELVKVKVEKVDEKVDEDAVEKTDISPIAEVIKGPKIEEIEESDEDCEDCEDSEDSEDCEDCEDPPVTYMKTVKTVKTTTTTYEEDPNVRILEIREKGKVVVCLALPMGNGEVSFSNDSYNVKLEYRV